MVFFFYTGITLQFHHEGFMNNIRHVFALCIGITMLPMHSAHSLASINTKLMGARIQNMFTLGAPDNVAKNPKQVSAYLDTLADKVTELKDDYTDLSDVSELASEIRATQEKTRKYLARKKTWPATSPLYCLRHAHLLPEQPDLINAVELIETGRKQENALRTRSKRIGLKPKLKKVYEDIQEFKSRLEAANIADSSSGAQSGQKIYEIEDKLTVLQKELQETLAYNISVAKTILGFNLIEKTIGTDKITFNAIPAEDRKWIQKIQKHVTQTFETLKQGMKEKGINESNIRAMYAAIFIDTNKTPIEDLDTITSNLINSTNGPLGRPLAGITNRSQIVTTYTEIDYQTRLSTAIIDSFATQCSLMKNNQPKPEATSASGGAGASGADDAVAAEPILSNGWLNNVQTYLASYHDLAVLAGLSMISARAAVDDIHTQIKKFSTDLRTKLGIKQATDAAAADEVIGESGGANSKEGRDALVEKTNNEYSILTADTKKETKDFCKTIEAELRTLHNKYQRLLKGNRIIAMKASKESKTTKAYKRAKEHTRTLGNTDTQARTDFKACKTALYDLLAMIQAIRSGSFTDEDKQALVQRPKTLANLFYTMDHTDENDDAQDISLEEKFDDVTAAVAEAKIGAADVLRGTRNSSVQQSEYKIDTDETTRRRTKKKSLVESAQADQTKMRRAFPSAAAAGEDEDEEEGGTSDAHVISSGSEQIIPARRTSGDAAMPKRARDQSTYATRALPTRPTRTPDDEAGVEMTALSSSTHAEADSYSDDHGDWIDTSAELGAGAGAGAGSGTGDAAAAQANFARELQAAQQPELAATVALGSPSAARKVARQVVAVGGDTDDDGAVSVPERRALSIAQRLLTFLSSPFKKTTPTSPYVYKLTQTLQLRHSDRDLVIEQISTDQEISELWYKAKSKSFIIKPVNLKKGLPYLLADIAYTTANALSLQTSPNGGSRERMLVKGYEQLALKKDSTEDTEPLPQAQPFDAPTLTRASSTSSLASSVSIDGAGEGTGDPQIFFMEFRKPLKHYGSTGRGRFTEYQSATLEINQATGPFTNIILYGTKNLRTDELLLEIESSTDILYYKPKSYVENRDGKNILLITDIDAEKINRPSVDRYPQPLWSMNEPPQSDAKTSWGTIYEEPYGGAH